jgi:hypothetical protein
MRHILRLKAVDFLLCLAAALSLAINLFQSFVIPDSLALNLPLTLGLTALALLILFTAFFNFKSSLISSTVIAEAIILFAIYARSTDFFARNGIVLQERDAYYLLIPLCAICVYALSRSRLGLVLLYMAGTTVFFFLTVLEYRRFLGWFLAFLLCAALLFLRRTYLSSPAVQRAERPPLLRYTAALLAVCGLALAASMGVFTFISEVFHPPAVPLALLTNYTVLEMAAKTGAASPVDSPNADNYYQKKLTPSSQPQKSPRKTDQVKTPSGATTPSGKGAPQPAPNGPGQVKAKAIRYFSRIPYAVIIACSIVAVVLLLYWLKYLLKRRRLQRIARSERSWQVVLLYPWYLEILRKIGIRRQKTETPLEFAHSLRRSVNTIRFEPVDFAEITALFNKVYYGGETISDAEFARLQAFARSFDTCCRQKIGTFQYLLHYLIL